MSAIPELLSFHEIVPRLLNASRRRIMTGVVIAIALIAFIDSRTGSLSLAGFYIFPMLVAAVVLSWPEILGQAFVCAVLRCIFDGSHSAIEYSIHFSFSLVTYIISGLFVMAVMRNRDMTVRHLAQLSLEQRLRNEAQERLKTLVEGSPAAILTLDQQGTVLAANDAANALFGVEPQQGLERRSIKPYMPVLMEALRLGTSREPFRTSVQAQGRKENGEIFLADIWFSTYLSREQIYLAAIVVDSSEEMRNREQQNLRQLSNHSRLVAGAVLHEIRNLCSAISVVYSNLSERQAPCRVEEIQGLETLVKGLGRVASLELYGVEEEAVEELPLQQLFDELRIIIEPNWREIDGSICWSVPESTVRVLAERAGLLQIFLNLAQNSLRAVQASPVRRLAISAATNGKNALVTFRDTGCGIPDPRYLFQPFQQGADVTGLGLFISRVLARGCGGELRFQPVKDGCSFVVELPLAGVRQRDA